MHLVLMFLMYKSDENIKAGRLIITWTFEYLVNFYVATVLFTCFLFSCWQGCKLSVSNPNV